MATFKAISGNLANQISNSRTNSETPYRKFHTKVICFPLRRRWRKLAELFWQKAFDYGDMSTVKGVFGVLAQSRF